MQSAGNCLNTMHDTSYREQILSAAFYDRMASINVRIWEPEYYSQTLLCVPGYMGNGGDFSEIARNLIPSGVRVVALDMIGRGKSTYFGDNRYYNLNSYMRCIRIVKNKFASESLSILATSSGGVHALYFCNADRFHPKNIILNDVPVVIDDRVIQGNIRISNELRHVFENEEEAISRFEAIRSEIIFGSDQTLSEFVKNRLIPTEGGYRYAIDPVLAGAPTVTAGQRFELGNLLSHPDSEILLMYGLASNYVDREILNDLQSHLPNLTIKTDFDSGHPMSLTCKEEIEAIVDFLISKP